MMPRQYDHEKVAELYKKGYKNREIAKICGMTNAAVGSVETQLKRKGLIPEKKPKKEKELDVGKIWALHNAGWGPKTIARDMRINEQEVIEALKRPYTYHYSDDPVADADLYYSDLDDEEEDEPDYYDDLADRVNEDRYGSKIDW